MEQRKTITPIPRETILEILRDNCPSITEEDWNGRPLVIRRTIPLSDMLSFVEDVVSVCSTESGEYVPELRDPVFRMYVLRYYTNIELFDPPSLADAYAVVYGSDLYEHILERIDKGQLGDIMAAIDAKLSYRMDIGIQSAREAMAKLGDIADTLTHMFDGVTPDDMKALTGALAKTDFDEQKIVDALLSRKAEA